MAGRPIHRHAGAAAPGRGCRGARIADLLGGPLGRRAGYAVRTASRVSRETRILVVTEALLTRKIQEDPLLGAGGPGDSRRVSRAFDPRRPGPCPGPGGAARAGRPGDSRHVRHPGHGAGLPCWDGGAAAAQRPSIAHGPEPHPVETRYWALGERRDAGRRALPTARRGCSMRQRATCLPSCRGRARFAGWGPGWAACWPRRAEVLPLHGTMRLEEQQEGDRAFGRGRGAASTQGRGEGDPATDPARDQPDRARDTDSGRPGGRGSPAFTRPRAGQTGHGAGERLLGGPAARQGRAGWARALRAVLGGIGAPSPAARSRDSPLRSLGARAGVRPLGREETRGSPVARSSARRVVEPGLGDPPHARPLEDGGPTDLGRSVARLGLAPRLGRPGHPRGGIGTRVSLAAACAAILEERDGSETAGIRISGCGWR